jgi:hypothetical protein
LAWVSPHLTIGTIDGNVVEVKRIAQLIIEPINLVMIRIDPDLGDASTLEIRIQPEEMVIMEY